MKFSVILFVIFAVPVVGFSATIYVPDHYSKIQEAIDASMGGDIIVVRPGTYVENIDFHGNAITVKSEMGPEFTIIDGNQVGSVVSFISGEALDSVLEGFKITNGDGGIYCSESSPTIINNYITNNGGIGWGGYYVMNGGICLEMNASPKIMNNIISENFTSCGGGIFCGEFTSPTIQNVFIYSNATRGCVTPFAQLPGFGGGIFCSDNSSPLILNSTILNNVALDGWNIDPGGGTIPGSGGGIYCSALSVPLIKNSIIWGNGASNGSQIYGNSIVSYCDVEGGWSGTGNIDSDPLFVVGPNGLHYMSQKAAGQAIDSPCVDTGSDLASNLGMATFWTRTDGVPDSGTVDMGFHYGPFSSGWTVPLYIDTYVIPENIGGIANFVLSAGAGNANRNYIILGGVSGIAPGIPLPGGMTTLPVNWDVFTYFVIALLNSSVFSNFFGTLDGSGTANAQLNVPPVPGFAPLTMHYAYALNNPWDFVSNPVAVEIVP